MSKKERELREKIAQEIESRLIWADERTPKPMLVANQYARQAAAIARGEM